MSHECPSSLGVSHQKVRKNLLTSRMCLFPHLEVGGYGGSLGPGSVLEIGVWRTNAPRASLGFCRRLETLPKKLTVSAVVACVVGRCNRYGFQHSLHVELARTRLNRSKLGETNAGSLFFLVSQNWAGCWPVPGAGGGWMRGHAELGIPPKGGSLGGEVIGGWWVRLAACGSAFPGFAWCFSVAGSRDQSPASYRGWWAGSLSWPLRPVCTVLPMGSTHCAERSGGDGGCARPMRLSKSGF